MDDSIRNTLLRMAVGNFTLGQFKRVYDREMTKEEEKYYLRTKKQIDEEKKNGIYEKSMYYVTSD
jgi:hypothetical protein